MSYQTQARKQKDLNAILLQVLLVSSGLFVLFIAFGMIHQRRQMDFILLDMLGKIPCLDIITDSISTLIAAHDSTLVSDPSAYINQVAFLFETMGDSLFQLFSVTVCVALCNLLWDIVVKKGPHIISTVGGVFLGYSVCTVYNMPIVVSIVLLLIYAVTDMICNNKPNVDMVTLLVKYLISCSKILFDLLSSIFLTGFISVLLVIYNVPVENIPTLIFMVSIFLIPFLALNIIRSMILENVRK